MPDSAERSRFITLCATVVGLGRSCRDIVEYICSIKLYYLQSNAPVEGMKLLCNQLHMLFIEMYIIIYNNYLHWSCWFGVSNSTVGKTGSNI